MNQGEKGDTGTAGAVGAAGAEGAVGRPGQQGEAGPAAMLDPAIAAEIKNGLRILTVATVFVYVGLFLFGAYVYVDAKHKREDLAKVATTTKGALCTLRLDLKVRIESSEDFLANIKSGKQQPIPGISNAQIQTGIDNQKRTVNALAPIKCP